MQNRVQLALRPFPSRPGAGRERPEEEHRDPPVVTLYLPNDKYDSALLSNYATINVVDALARLPGVGSVKVIGAGEYAMRIWMDPGKLQSFNLDP